MSTDERALSLKELADIDQFYFKAHPVLTEAQNYIRSYNFDLAVRRSQEALELYIKSIFRFVGQEHPKTHNLEKQIYELFMLLAEYDVTSQEVAAIVLANSTLCLWRLPSLYGDEKLRIAKLFGPKEAELAVSYAEKARFICEKIRACFYRRSHAPKA